MISSVANVGDMVYSDYSGELVDGLAEGSQELKPESSEGMEMMHFVSLLIYKEYISLLFQGHGPPKVA